MQRMKLKYKQPQSSSATRKEFILGEQRYGGIEAGGTKFICAVGDNAEIFEEVRFPTTDPGETIARAIDFFTQQGPLAGIGIGSFGPLDLNPSSPTFGYITSTPKANWAQTDITGKVERALSLPVAIDTDVNAAALAEQLWGAARGLHTFIYLTVGTGIGGGGMTEGNLLHGLMHPEMGHIPIPHDLNEDPFEGVCPVHGDCLEGQASGPALQARWGVHPEQLPSDHPAWALEAKYLGQALAIYTYVLSPQRIIIGGGVMEQEVLMPLIDTELQKALGNYAAPSAAIEPYVVAPELGERAGVLGAIALARRRQI